LSLKNVPTVIDLFCGCGGLSLGFEHAGYTILGGVDHWADAVNTFNQNHKNSIGLVCDLLTYQPQQLVDRIGTDRIDVIIGGPPCQGFSIAGKRIVEDKRNLLYKAFVQFVDFFQPKAFVLENVPNVMAIGGGIIKNKMITDFQNLGYHVECKILLASDFGVPQNRKRAFFIGTKNRLKFEFPIATTTQHITAKEAISDLPPTSLTDGNNYPVLAQSVFQKQMRKNSLGVFNHQITVHNERTCSIIDLVPDGGNYKDLPKELQQTRRVNIAWTRLNSNKPSFTIDTGHNHHFHYEYNRVPTVRESARLQSFPDNFIFLGSKTSQLRQVGNAVPPLLAKAIAEKLKEIL